MSLIEPMPPRCGLRALADSVSELLNRVAEEVLCGLEKRGVGSGRSGGASARLLQPLRLLLAERMAAAAQGIVGLLKREVEEYRRRLERQNRLLEAVLSPVVRLKWADSVPPSGLKTTTGDKDLLLLSDSTRLPPSSRSFTSSDIAAAESDEEWRGSDVSSGNDETDKGGEGGQTASSEELENQHCIICEKTFRHKGHLVKHVRTHSDSPEHLCGVCGQQLESSKGLSDHLRSHRDNLSTRGTCEICGKTFQNMETHKRSHTGVRPFSCNVCGKSFPRDGALRRHKKIHNRKKPDACHICGQMFTENQLLQEHLKKHEDKNANQSQEGDVGEDSEALEQKANTESTLGEKSSSFCCKVCGDFFYSRGFLRKHAETHCNNPKNICGVCGEHTESSKGLSDHLRSHRDNLSTRGTCEICGVTFQNMETHKRSHTGVRPFSCVVCGKSFPRHGALRRHKKIHIRKKPDSCQICGQTFTENQLLQEHLKKHEDKNGNQSEGDNVGEDCETPTQNSTESTICEKSSFCCKVCGDFFYSRGFLRKHAKTHCNDSKNMCGLCGERLDTPDGLLTHLQSHRQISGTCSICGKTFQNMETHMRSHTGFKPYRCTVCSKRFPRPGALRQHKRTHSKTFKGSSTLRTHVRGDSVEIHDTTDMESPSDCSSLEPEAQSIRTQSSSCCKVCRETFQTKASLTKHVKSHSSESVCGICGECLLLSETLTDHLQTHKETGNICHICGKNYQNIETHMRSHTGIKPYHCSICGKSFPRPGALRRHKKTHSGERPYICEFCGKTFTDGCTLTTHIKNHTGDKPVNRVSCETCGKSLASAHVLEVHKRIHTGEKPFLCRVCGKSFRQLAGLNAHMLTHTGEKPFSCSLCSKSFSTKGYLQTHIRFHKKERAFSCHLCWKAFVTNTDLKKHLLTHTGKKPYSCQICGKSYQEKRSRDVHMKVHQVVHSNKEPIRRQDGLQPDFIQL
ncbi:zinc finger protein 709 [Kryptolebias marmoratus]|uniref:Zinc finger protein 709-like n=1 Tax=Kryptolebias marmoratus TaxID=37003 RepID=A0A3Q2ZTB4_KRYMA|nr:zinc finger protein 709 [Kryptolebias marmoratus]